MEGRSEHTEELKWYIQSKHAVYYVLGFIEIMLLFRLLFKLLGANPASGFAGFIYAITGIFTAPFYGIFNTVYSPGYTVRSIFEPGTIVAMLVYAIIAWGVINLIRIKALRS